MTIGLRSWMQNRAALAMFGAAASTMACGYEQPPYAAIGGGGMVAMTSGGLHGTTLDDTGSTSGMSGATDTTGTTGHASTSDGIIEPSPCAKLCSVYAGECGWAAESDDCVASCESELAPGCDAELDVAATCLPDALSEAPSCDDRGNPTAPGTSCQSELAALWHCARPIAAVCEAMCEQIGNEACAETSQAECFEACVQGGEQCRTQAASVTQCWATGVTATCVPNGLPWARSCSSELWDFYTCSGQLESPDCAGACEEIVAAGCPEGPPSINFCTGYCEQNLVGDCGTLLADALACSGADPVVVCDEGVPNVPGCDALFDAFYACAL